jgi:surface antigen
MIVGSSVSSGPADAMLRRVLLDFGGGSMLGATTRAVALLVGLALLTTSCANTMQGMGEDASSMGSTISNNPKATLGALGGAGGGALIAGLAGASPAWIIGSALMGGLLGGYIGNRLDEKDKRMAAQAAAQAFENNRTGQKSVWNNPESGNRGEIVPVKTYQVANGQYCRRYEQTIYIGGERQQTTGTACRQADGSWQIQG